MAKKQASLNFDSFTAGGERIFTVTELTAIIRELLQGTFSSVWLGGEVSNLARPSSGHLYFTLKDQGAQIRAVIWRGTASRLKFELEDGLAVLAHGKLDVYPPRGEYQLVVEQVLPRGMGPLEWAFQQLKEKLAARGWFDPSRKRSLPPYPRRLAIVTSPSGAVVRDMLRILGRRWPLTQVWICPVAVQGDEAPQQIAATLGHLNRLALPPDVVILGRGGGSLEDLWAFNTEIVAAAIHASRIPIVSAVGHETDYTIADFVADRRAATPSEAAELVVPDAAELRQGLEDLRLRLFQAIRAGLLQRQARVLNAARSRGLRRPLDRIHDLAQRVDLLGQRVAWAWQTGHRQRQQQFKRLADLLDSLSPLRTLARGFSVTQDAATGQILTEPRQARPGQQLRTRLLRGHILSRVESASEGDPA